MPNESPPEGPAFAFVPTVVESAFSETRLESRSFTPKSERATPPRGERGLPDSRQSATQSRSAPGKARWRRLGLPAAAASATLLLAGLTYAIINSRSASNEPAPKSPATRQTVQNEAGKGPGKVKPASKKPAPVRRVIEVGPHAEFRTIADALADTRKYFNPSLRSRQIIKVAGGQTYAERIVIDSSFPRGVQLEVAGAEPAILAPAGPAPIVSVVPGKEPVQAFRLAGFHLDATGKDVAIELRDWVPAAALENLEIRGFSQAGVALHGVQSYSRADEKIRLERLVFRQGAPQAVVMFRAEAVPSMHVRVAQCRFLGPSAAGISVPCDVIDLEINESVFYQVGKGVALEGKDRTWRDVVFAANTFQECDIGVVMAEMPGATSNGFGFYNNLFAGNRQGDVVVESGYQERAFLTMLRTNPGGAAFNWTSRPKPEESQPRQLAFLFEAAGGRFEVQPRFESTDPGSPLFLAPAEDGPQRSVGLAPALDPKKFGRQIGAVRPR